MRPFPWFWLIRLVLITVVVVAWAESHPHTPTWQLFLAAFAGNAAIEGLRWGYRQEQAQLTERRQKRDRLP